MAYQGTVTEWNDEEGCGVIEVPQLGRVWAHFSTIQSEPGAFRSLSAGQQVAVEIEARPSDEHSDAPGFRWVASEVRKVAQTG